MTMFAIAVALILAASPAPAPTDGVCDIAGASSSTGCVWWRDDSGYLWPADPAQPNEGRPNGAGGWTPAAVDEPNEGRPNGAGGWTPDATSAAPARPVATAHVLAYTGVPTGPYAAAAAGLILAGAGARYHAPPTLTTGVGPTGIRRRVRWGHCERFAFSLGL